MKKLLSLLSVLTISGTAIPTTIAASPYKKEETIKNSDINFLKLNNLEQKQLSRNKRYSYSKCVARHSGEYAKIGSATGAAIGVSTGAAAGAIAGSVVPGIGTVIGAIIGALSVGAASTGISAATMASTGAAAGAIDCPKEIDIKEIILNKDLGIIDDDDSVSLLNEIKKNNPNLDIENLYIEYTGNDKNMPNFLVEKDKLLNQLKKDKSIFSNLEKELQELKENNQNKSTEIERIEAELEKIKTKITIDMDKLKDYKRTSAKIITSTKSKYKTNSYVIVNYLVQRDLTDSSYLLIDWIENLYNPWKKDYEEFRKNEFTYSEKERKNKDDQFRNRIAQLRHDLLQDIEIIKLDSYVKKLYERIKSLESELTRIKVRIDELETSSPHLSKCGTVSGAVATGISVAEMTLKSLPIIGQVASAISQLISASCYLANDFS